MQAGAPEELSQPASDRLSFIAPVDVVGPSSSGRLVVASGDAIFEVDGALVEERPLYATGDDPVAIGAVHAISRRQAGGAWVAAESGLFVVDGLYASYSRVEVEGALHAITEAKEGAFSGVWLGANAGLFRWRAESFEQLTLKDQSGPVEAVSVSASSNAALVTIEAKPSLILHEGEKTLSEEVPTDLGVRAPFASLGNALYAASDSGLVRWDPAADPKWTRLSLQAGEAGLPVRALAADPVANVLWIRTDDRLIQLEGEKLTSFTAPAVAAADTAQLAVDGVGDVWLDDGAELVRFKTGVGSVDAAFTTDVQPWLTQHCTQCHADFSDAVVFAPKAENALQRVRTGDMPRCQGGVPCASEQHLTADEYAVLEAWIRGGKKP